MKIPANVKYAIIEQMMNREDNMLNVKWLCDTAGVSRSGYYHYLKTEDLREQREQQDRADFQLILDTSVPFRTLLKNKEIRQSMSRRAVMK